MVTVVTIDGQTVHTIVAAAYGKLEAAFRSATGKDLIITSGFRSNAEQTALFLARYRPQTSGNGPYGDVRVYKGVRYVRISSAGTVAVPGTSRHENYRALDVRDSGADNGVTVAGTVRANWLRSNASKYGFNPAGYGFGEPWHIEFNGSLGDTATTGGTPVTFENLPTDYLRALQSQLGVEPDGIFGTASTKALQTKVGTAPDGNFGLDSIKKTQTFIGAEADGIWGPDTTNKFKLAIDAWRFSSPLHVLIGDPSTRALQTQLGVTPDGVIGAGTTEALQRKIGATPDGIFGRGSLGKLQSFVGATPDGIWGPDTAAKVQSAIAAGKFGTAVTPPVVTPPAPKPATGIPAGTAYGIDIAWPQTGAFDWNAVKTKYNFAIIKAAGAEDGLYGPADLLDKHLAGARSVGLKVGFYFFNNNRMSIKDQADKFISVLTTRIRPGDFVALDIENVGSQAVAFNPAQALEFAHYVELGLGVKTLMYLNRSHVNGADWSQVVNAGHPLWLATLDGLENGLTYLLPNSVKWWGKASIVQFSSTVPIVGYPHGAVDQDIGFVADMERVAFVAIPAAPVVPAEPEPEVPDEPEIPTPTPVDPDAVPSWFKRFLEGLIGFIKSFLGVTS